MSAMGVPFGFSVGDFIARIGMSKDSIDTQTDSKGASTEYLELSRELYSLHNGLMSIEKLNTNEPQRQEFVTVMEAVRA